ncbi:27404_t:CDS:2 [Dentiscutata erythropus]|uniref:27404_t:CDS:1 n=1 Tax=Dentiscutata erythropus TaxID=1348616 RepID=A0A9N9IIW8_9GLOM|nr:27404_t:CDS:2 [Dentiscutata erythropus]
MPRKDHHKKTQNKLNVKLRSDNINLNRNEIFTKCYELENSKLTELETQIESLISKLERYYNVIQRTYSILQEVFGSNEIADLCNEIREICDEDFVCGSNIPSASDNIVYNSFDDALNASEEKIAEIVEDGREQFPTLVRSQRFYDANEQEFDTDKFIF